MSYNSRDLLDLLDLEPIEFNIYRGRNRDIGSGRVFGGQVMAQALVAAQRTVEEERTAHSLHGYFILPGDLDAPIVYFVDRLRDGKSFTTRRVTAIQHGQAVFNMSVSFHRAETGLEHQSDMPDAGPPEPLTPEIEVIRAKASLIPETVRGVLTQDRPFDFRLVDIDPFDDDGVLTPCPIKPQPRSNVPISPALTKRGGSRWRASGFARPCWPPCHTI
jgi:acyl-CoA thioesterase-2